MNWADVVYALVVISPFLVIAVGIFVIIGMELRK
jgi:hypothetical protein